MSGEGLEIIFDIIIVLCGLVGIFFALACAWLVSRIQVKPGSNELTALRDAEGANSPHQKVYEISQEISDGATAFLYSEYKIMGVFMVGMSIAIVVLIGSSGTGLWVQCPSHPNATSSQAACRWIDGIFSAIAFNIGAVTSIVAGYIGMRIAVYSNSRTCLMAERGYAEAFGVAFKGGIVMGFGLTSIGLLNLFLTIMLFRLYYHHGGDEQHKVMDARKALLSAVAPFGLGGSSIALFGRVGGGIFTKAADVGADLVGKVDLNIPEDDPRNPGVIADNVGDNVGDIAGMGSDLFGSFGEATCAALVVSGTSPQLLSDPGYLLFPLMITAIGLIVCMFTSFVAFAFPPTEAARIEPALKLQLIVSTVLLTIAFAPMCYLCLPKHKFELGIIFRRDRMEKYWWEVYICILAGLWSGLIIGICTEYFTSHASRPTRQVAEACRTGAATNIIHGLALGYESAIVPCFCIAFSVYLSLSMCGCYGVAMAALGILSSMSIGLTIDAYGPISDNAGGIAEMAGMDHSVRERTDALDGAGNTTAAIGKGFAIGSAAFVAVALFGAFMTQIYEQPNQVHATAVSVNILDPRTFFGLIVGSMLPYWFSAMTMKSVGKAAMEMVREIKHQFETIEGLARGVPGVKPDSQRCIAIATNASLKEMILPGALVVLTPIITGIFFGPETLAGLLPGSMASGVMMATSAANTGGAWDNAKKYIEAGFMKPFGKGSEVHKAAVVGDTVGDPLKDTSGPALNILVKLMAIISVVFAPMMAYDKDFKPAAIGGLIFNHVVCHFKFLNHACPVPPGHEI